MVGFGQLVANPCFDLKQALFIRTQSKYHAKYVLRRDRVEQNVEMFDSILAAGLIMRTQTLPEVNINHKQQNCLLPWMML